MSAVQHVLHKLLHAGMRMGHMPCKLEPIATPWLLDA